MKSLKRDLLTIFRESFQNTIEMMTSVSLQVKEVKKSKNTYSHQRPGVSSIVGFVGVGLKGRSLLWVPSEVALEMTQKVIGERLPTYKEEMVLFTIGEINNVLSGHTTSKINNLYGLSLRLTPPSIFAGSSLFLVTPKLESYTLQGLFQEEEIYLDVALEGVRLNG